MPRYLPLDCFTAFTQGISEAGEVATNGGTQLIGGDLHRLDHGRKYRDRANSTSGRVCLRAASRSAILRGIQETSHRIVLCCTGQLPSVGSATHRQAPPVRWNDNAGRIIGVPRPGGSYPKVTDESGSAPATAADAAQPASSRPAASNSFHMDIDEDETDGSTRDPLLANVASAMS